MRAARTRTRIALVTGAGSGIGRAAALALGEAGFQVVLAGRRPEPLEAVAREIHRAGAKALAVQQHTSLTRLIEEGLQLRLRSPQVAAKFAKPKIPVFKGRGGLVAGLNPVSNKAMLDAADDDA